MFDLHAELAAITDAFHARAIEHAVCGAFALAAHGHPRATKDIDIVLPPSALDDARTTLRALGYGLAAAPMTFESGITVHRVSRVEDQALTTVDLILADGPLATVLADRVQLPWRNGSLSVVSRASLVAMKRLADRPQDRADLAALGESES